VLVLDEPTQGVDISAKAGIYHHLTEFAASGSAAIVFSSDTEELAALCDRVLIMRDGRVDDELTGDALTHSALARRLLRSTTEIAS
jgi:ABC-type sugar transport system ATPase subunit